MPDNPRRAFTRRSGYWDETAAEERTASARAAANARWAAEPDRTAALRPARDGRLAGYYAEPDRLGITDPALREKMARNAQAAEMQRMRRIQLTRKRQAREAAAEAAADAARDGEAV